jgi:hypothetical protein
MGVLNEKRCKINKNMVLGKGLNGVTQDKIKENNIPLHHIVIEYINLL